MRTCGLHYALLTVQGSNKDERPLGCHICKPGESRQAKRAASQYELQADVTIRKLFPSPARVITEGRVLKGFNGGMDFSILFEGGGCQRTIDIEVDGEHHFKGKIHQESSAKQRQVDAQKDAMALNANRHLLRLHYEDRAYWEREIKRAKRVVEEDQHRSNVFYSKSYVRKNKYRN